MEVEVRRQVEVGQEVEVRQEVEVCQQVEVCQEVEEVEELHNSLCNINILLKAVLRYTCSGRTRPAR